MRSTVISQIRARCQIALIIGALFAGAVPAHCASLQDAFDSQKAYAYTAEIAGFGERWPGSPGHQKTEDLTSSPNGFGQCDPPPRLIKMNQDSDPLAPGPCGDSR
jgi:hypothetical protein